MDYVVKICQEVLKTAPTIKGCYIKRQSKAMRHYTAEFGELDENGEIEVCHCPVKALDIMRL